jgi:anthranilate phosphoribosyltransferase
MTKNPVQTLVKHVGRGKTLAKDLSIEQAREALERLLGGEFTQSQTGAFLQALRIKETTADELVGAALGVASFQASTTLPAESIPLVVNVAFDTPRKGGVLSILAAAYLRRTGLAHPVVVWEPPSLFLEVGAVEASLEANAADPWLTEGRCPMVAVREMVPAWAGLSAVRAELGFRTILNTLEKVISPFPSAPAVVGISHGNFFHRLAQVLSRLGSVRGVAVQGHHGTCDLNLGEKPTPVATCAGSEVVETAHAPDAENALDASVLLLSRLEAWPDLVRDPGSPLWPSIRAQAAFLLSASQDIPLHDATARVHSAGAPHGR